MIPDVAFEDLFGGQADLVGDLDGAQIIQIYCILAQTVGDAELVELSYGISLQANQRTRSSVPGAPWIGKNGTERDSDSGAPKPRNNQRKE